MFFKQEQEQEKGTRAIKATILMVDDEEAILKLMTRSLERAGYHVLGAASASNALKIASRHKAPIDLLVTDLVMPRMDGFMMSTRLARARPKMKQLWTSGYADVSPSVRRDIQEGHVPFLAKPYTPDELLARVRDLLARPGQ